MSFQNYDPYNQGWYLLPITGSLSVPSSIDNLTQGQIDTLNAHTIQGLIELVYVRVGNDLLYEGLNGLDQAISETTQTIDVLADIQQLHNALEVSGLGSFSSWFNFQAPSGDFGASHLTNYQKYYNAAASAFFGIPIVPDFIFKQDQGGTILDANIGGSPVTYESFASNLADYRNLLSQRVDTLSQINANNPAVLNDPNSLYNAAKQVLSDLPPEQVGGGARIAWTDAKLWVLDGQTIDDGKDLAQVNPTQVIIGYEAAGDLPLTMYQNMNLDGLGVGDGWLVGGGQARNASGELYIDQPMFVTYSGRLAIASWKDPNAAVKGGVIEINPVDDNNAVVNPIEEGTLYQGSVYLGSFGARNDASRTGAIQQNITLAITAGQGLNDSQTEQVRSYMFLFEEYYKSASALLNKITQIIEKFAQGIRPA